MTDAPPIVECRIRWSRVAELDRAKRMERLRRGITSVQQAVEEWPCGDRLVPREKSFLDFASTGFWQCKMCFHVWQDGRENDTETIRPRGGDEEVVRVCPRCAKHNVKWINPVPKD